MKILLAIDGSKNSDDAVAFLSNFPFDDPPELTIVHTCSVPDLHALEGEVSFQIQQLVDSYRDEGKNLLQSTESKCQAWTKSVSTQLLAGHPAEEILKVAEQEQIDLIVLGCRGLGAVNRFFLGSVSDRVAKYALCSVLVVRGSEADATSGLRSILFAHDGSPTAAQAIDRFSQMQLGSQCQATVLGVQELISNRGAEGVPAMTQLLKIQTAQLQASLQQAQEKLKATEAKSKILFVEKDDAVTEIIETAEELKTDLIVMGSTGKTTWERLLLGSVTSRVLYHAHCSIWIERLRPDDPVHSSHNS